MTNIAFPATFKGKTPKIDPANAAMLLILFDHFVGYSQQRGRRRHA